MSLDAWTRWGLRHPRGLLVVVLVVSALVGAAASRVHFDADVTQLLTTPAARTLRQVDQAFGLGQRAYVLVQGPPGRREDLIRFGQELKRRLKSDPAIAHVALGPPVDPDQALDALLLPYGPLYFAPDQLDELERLLTRAGMEEQLEQQAERLGLLGLGELDHMIARDPLDLHRALLRRVQTLEGSFHLDPDTPYTLTPDGRALLIEVRAAPAAAHDPARVVGAIEAARAAVAAEPWAAGLRARGTGAAYLAEESQRVIQADVIRGLSASILLSALITALVLRVRLDQVAWLLLPTLWGSGVGVAVYAAAAGDVALVSLACTSVLIGLGVDFTVHLAAAARTSRPELGGQVTSLAAVRANRGALVLAAATSLAAFGAFVLLGQGFLREMGWLTGLGLVACLLAALVVLPPLLARLEGGARGLRDLGVSWLTRWATRRARPLLAVCAVISLAAAGLVILRPPRLEDDLRRIHARNSAPLATQEAIAKAFGGSREAVLLVVRAQGEQAALDAVERLDRPLRRLVREGVLTARTSLAALVPPRDEQEQVLALLARHDPGQVAADLRAALEATGFEPSAFASYISGLAAAVQQRTPLGAADLDRLGLGPLREALLAVRPDGSALALVQVYPARDPWSAKDRGRLLQALAAAATEAGVDAAPTGLHVVSAEAAGAVSAEFSRISGLTALLVLALLFVRLRRPRLVLLALTPAALGTLWTAAVLVLSGTRLNLMNLGVLPMVLAIGIDDGIHLLHRYQRGETGASPAYRATCAAVLLTSLTTMITFGSLWFSRNQGIASVGLLSFVGVGASLLASVLVLPALLAVAPAECPAPEPRP